MKKIFLLLLLAILPLFSQTQNPASPPNPPTLQRSNPPITDLDPFFRRCERNGYAGSVLVAKGGEILLEKGYGMQDREAQKAQAAATVFSIGSITKQFTGAAILKLESKGRLATSDPLWKYFPDAPAGKRDITLHQLATHTAGFRDAIGDDYEAIGADDFVKRALASPLLFKPGERYEYSNVGYSLLGIIIEKVSGMGYEEFLYRHLWQPAGMERTGYLRPAFAKPELAVGYRNGNRWGTALDRAWRPEGPGWHLRANGGVLSTVGDMYRWYQALAKFSVLDEGTRAKYFTPHVREYPDGETWYSYGWVVEKLAEDRTLIWHNGGNGVYNAYMGFVPETGVCVIISSNSNNKIADDYLRPVMEILRGEYKAPDEAWENRVSGHYATEAGARFRLRFNELGEITAEFEDAATLLLLAGDGSENAAECEAVSARTLAFVADSRAGKAAGLAKALGIPEEEAKKEGTNYWAEKTAAFGPIQKMEAVGTVARTRFGMHLTFLKVQFEKATRYFTYVWEGENLKDLREAGILEKGFEKGEQPGEFVSRSNGLRAVFGEDGSLVLKRKQMEVPAFKR